MTTVAEIEPSPPATADSSRLEYVPGLDGLRGLFLIFVLVDHAGLAAAFPGGAWMGVSGFFTLSGFLITSLLLLEHRQTGGVALGHFWNRRMRRLLPAAALTLFLIAVASMLHPYWPQQGLRTDLSASLLYVVNWRFILTNHTYATAFSSGPSPVVHFWSLSIEEQFYLLFPVLVVGLLALRRRWRSSTVVLLVGLWIFSGIRAASWYTPSDWSRAYYSTDSRLGEMLMGAVLALVLSHDGFSSWASSVRARRLIVAISFACVAGWALACATLAPSSPVVYHGGLMLVSVLSAGVVVAVTFDTPFRRIASNRALRWFGARTYAIYLLHFPVFLILSPVRLHAYLPWPTTLQGLRWATLVLGSAVTVGLAALSHRYVEAPIRSGARLPGRRFLIAAPLSVLALLVFVNVVPFRGTDDPTLSLQHLVSDAHRQQVHDRKLWDASPHRVLVLGDSLSWFVSTGLTDWGKTHSAFSLNLPRPGCGSARGGVTDYLGLKGRVSAVCPSLVTDITQQVHQLHPTSVVIMASGRDLANWTFPDGSNGHLGQPAFDRWMAGQVQLVADAAARQRVPVVWLLEPHMRANAFSTRSWREFPANDPARMDRLNALITQAVGRLPSGSRVKTLDLGAFARRHPGGEFDPGFRPDGAHFSIPGILDIARWLGPNLMARESARR